MSWVTTHDVDEFLAAAGEYLHTHPAHYSVLLTVSSRLRSWGPHAYGAVEPRFGWWTHEGGPVVGAFVWTPPHPMQVTDVPGEAVPELVTMLDPGDRINAERGVADAIAGEWSRQRGTPTHVGMRSRLFRLGELVPADPMPAGRARLAGAGDRDLLLSWHASFYEEIGEASSDLGRAIDDRVGYGGLMLWEVDGTPVSMAGRTEPVAGIIRVAPVFTPRHLRRRGYAAAATAAVSQAARELAGEVVLYTDLANPTSNGVYQRLGYRPVRDQVVLHLGDEPDGSARD